VEGGDDIPSDGLGTAEESIAKFEAESLSIIGLFYRSNPESSIRNSEVSR
jgi:hypothetical protein